MMSALSFVALSLQTTHLDPATVSKASYVKLVDGNITRLDAIPIIPPTSHSEIGPESFEGSTTWADALAQLSMMVGKLPIVSYYRDADKEIFQAASRRAGASLPHFQWLDCRALARELLPDLPEYQLSTVLKSLDLYEAHADSSMVEQTAHIVLELARKQGATTVHELWGDLYDQPDELLNLEATLEGLASPERAPEYKGAPTPAVPVVVPPSESPEPNTPDAQESPPQLADEPSVVSGEVGDDEIDAPSGDIEVTASALASGEDEANLTEGSNGLSDSDAVAAFRLAHYETMTEDTWDSTAQAVIENENLEQPEFLKVPVRDEPSQEQLEQGNIAEVQADEVNTQSDSADAPETVTESVDVEPTATVKPTGISGNGVGPTSGGLASGAVETIPEDSSSSTPQPVPESENFDQPEFLKVPVEDEPAPEELDQNLDGEVSAEVPLLDDPLTVPSAPASDSGESDELSISHEPTDSETTIPVEAELAQQNNEPAVSVEPPDDNMQADPQLPLERTTNTKPFQPVDQVVETDAAPLAGASPTQSVAMPQYIELHAIERAPVESKGQTSSKTSRVFGLLGMLVFGLLAVLGLVLTVMATLLFFTTNNLLLETKIAGVVLTATISLLSLLMTSLSYRSFRRK